MIQILFFQIDDNAQTVVQMQQAHRLAQSHLNAYPKLGEEHIIYQFESKKNLHNVCLNDYDIVVLFAAASYLYIRPTYESWADYFYSFIRRRQPQTIANNMEYLKNILHNLPQKKSFQFCTVVTCAETWLDPSIVESGWFILTDAESIDNLAQRLVNKIFCVQALKCSR